MSRAGIGREVLAQVGTRVLAATAVAAAAVVAVGGPASAAASLSVSSSPPVTVTVGITVTTTVTITNTATPPESAGTITLSTIKVTPSCGAFVTGTCPAASADPGVFQLAASATGHAGSACSGTTFTVTVVDATSGQVQLTPSSPVVLGPPGSATDTCRIDVGAQVVRMPAKDASMSPGLQTAWLATATGSSSVGGATAIASGTATVNVISQPGLITAVSGAVAVGGQVHDTATVSGGFNPTGTINFTLFGPNDATCAGSPGFSFNATVAGNGSYPTPNITVLAPGSYRFRAFYTGDVNNASTPLTACGDPRETVAVRVAGRQPTPGDYDGDGRTDVSVYRPSAGGWYVLASLGQVSGVTWGTTGDVPVPGDYDGNGLTDVAVFRPSTGGWFVQGQAGASWGTSGDIPVPGDYDGNGTTDIAVFRPSTGAWFVRGQAGAVWGTSGDIPVPGDYDGDGKTDFAVFRPSTGGWFVRRSTAGPTSVTWGAPGDVPAVGAPVAG
ncbi:MAG: FG-GAP repeat domain-containing protein [Acidimicrobiales bacterium]